MKLSISMSLVLSLLLCGLTAAQDILWQKIGKKNVQWLTGAVAFIGDINKDGYDDIVNTAWLSALDPSKHIMLISGKDGSTIRTHLAPRTVWATWTYHFVTAAGDMDGDGIGDYVALRRLLGTGCPAICPVIVEILSGKDDHTIWKLQGSFSEDFAEVMIGDLDVDGDKKPDLILTVPREKPNGAVHVYRNNGTLIYKLPFLTRALGRMGDLDKDGCDDFLVGRLEPLGRGVACVLSGRTGKVLVEGFGEKKGDGIGTGKLAGCGDVDADGVLDFVASSQGLRFQSSLVRVFSGKTGKAIFTWRKRPGAAFGQAIATAVDLDLDGVPDLLVGSGEIYKKTGQGGRVHWFSLRDGREVTQLFPPGLPPYHTLFGAGVNIGRPQPGNPFPVFLVSDVFFGLSNSPSSQGRLTLYRASPTGVTSFGQACKGSLAAKPKIGLRDLKSKGLRLHLTAAPLNAPVALILGISRTRWGNLSLPLDLDPLGFKGCKLFSSVELLFTKQAGNSGNDRGFAFFDLPLPLVTKNPRFTLHGQWLVLGSGTNAPGALSDALSWQH